MALPSFRPVPLILPLFSALVWVLLLPALLLHALAEMGLVFWFCRWLADQYLRPLVWLGLLDPILLRDR